MSIASKPSLKTRAPAAGPMPLRQIGNNERFVAFAFAGADMVIETDVSGIVTYAAGAFRNKFGQAAEWFVGRPLLDLVAPADHETVETALSVLVERGRLQPSMIRLSDPERTQLSLAGIVLPSPGRPMRLSLSLAQPPAPLARRLKGACRTPWPRRQRQDCGPEQPAISV